jgi:hypothetical protein
MKPTKKGEYVRVGDRVTAGSSMAGVVEKILPREHGLASVLVKWESGSTGRHTITTLRRIGSLDRKACWGGTRMGAP